MDTLSWILLESPPVLGGILGVVCFGLLVFWRRGGSPKPLLGAMLAALLLLAVQSLVVTPREHAKRLLADIELDLLDERTDRLAAALSDDFHAFDMGRAEFLDFVQDRYDAMRLTWLRRLKFRALERGDGRLVAKLSYLADVQSQDYRGTFSSQWRVTFVKTPLGWRMQSAEALDPGWKTIQRAR